MTLLAMNMTTTLAWIDRKSKILVTNIKKTTERNTTNLSVQLASNN